MTDKTIHHIIYFVLNIRFKFFILFYSIFILFKYFIFLYISCIQISIYRFTIKYYK